MSVYHREFRVLSALWRTCTVLFSLDPLHFVFTIRLIPAGQHRLMGLIGERLRGGAVHTMVPWGGVWLCVLVE